MTEEVAEAKTQPETGAAAQGIDLEELARKIFELLLREIMLENERLGR